MLGASRSDSIESEVSAVRPQVATASRAQQAARLRRYVNEQHNTQMLPISHEANRFPPETPAWLAIRNPGSFKAAAFSPPSRKRFPRAQEPSDADTIVSGTHVNACACDLWRLRCFFLAGLLGLGLGLRPAGLRFGTIHSYASLRRQGGRKARRRRQDGRSGAVLSSRP